MFDIADEFYRVPVVALSSITRNLLASRLDCLSKKLTNGLKGDFTGLGDLCGFEYQQLERWRTLQQGTGPTEALLVHWSKVGDINNANIGCLMKYLLQIGRRDLFFDVDENVKKDVKRFLESEKTFQHIFPVVNVNCELNTQSILSTIVPKKCEKFDVYLSWDLDSEEATETVLQWNAKLNEIGIRSFVGPQHHLLGEYQVQSFVDVIEKQCRRLVIFLTENYVKNEECVFEMQYVRNLDPIGRKQKVIPVIFDKNIAIPNILRQIRSIEWHRSHLRKDYWNALVESLRAK